ncbi:MAG: YbjN domain-containing protein [Gemmatimonadota bacterium]|nr:YbjN domain-containing protein [Gemmatimonadota bacterium]MDH3426914.1 YbjN domain-containing protein [Gemmatimonadota bacterium]
MISRDDFESFMIRMELNYEEIGENLWIIDPDLTGRSSVVVSYSPPLIVLRSAVEPAPETDAERLKLYSRLLEMNASELVHGSYGLEDGEIVLGDALELENLDFSEFQASFESISLALTAHKDNLTTG